MSTASHGYAGPYRLLNIINTGQTSQVWQAYHDGSRKYVAVKMLQREYARDKEHVRFLKWEYTVAGKIEHERICRGLLREYFSSLGRKVLSRLLNGNDLMRRFGLEPSPVIGSLLAGLEELRAIGRINTREEAFRAASSMLKSKAFRKIRGNVYG